MGGRSRKKKPPPFRVWQPIALFVLGAAAFVWEVVVEKTDRPALLALIALMFGFPLAWVTDKLRTEQREEEEQ